MAFFRCNFPSKYPDPTDFLVMLSVIEYTPDKVIIEWSADPPVQEVITNKELIPLFKDLTPGELYEVNGKRDWKTDELTELKIL